MLKLTLLSVNLSHVQVWTMIRCQLLTSMIADLTFADRLIGYSMNRGSPIHSITF